MRVSFILSAAVAATVFAAPLRAHPTVYAGTLSNAGEPSPAEQSSGTGSVAVTLDLDTFQMRVQVSFSGLTGNVSNSHLHCCTAAAGTGSAGVATTLPTFAGFPGTGSGVPDVKSGSYDQTFDMTLASSWNPAFVTANGGTTGSAFSVLATGIASGNAYLNIHTSFVPGGEIRAFLTPVPEPGTYGLMLGGFTLIAWTARRRRQASPGTGD